MAVNRQGDGGRAMAEAVADGEQSMPEAIS
jgi:hypothetical protein